MTRTNSDPLEHSEIVSCLEDHPKWEREEESQETDDAVQKGGCMEFDEFRFSHSKTDGYLLLRSPTQADTSTVCEGLLQQALDRRERSNAATDPFLTQLTAAQYTIAETYETEYITAISDPVSILRVQFWKNHCRETVDQLMTDVADASEEIQAFHRELIRTIQKYQ
jgi:hypothetical protein